MTATEHPADAAAPGAAVAGPGPQRLRSGARVEHSQLGVLAECGQEPSAGGPGQTEHLLDTTGNHTDVTTQMISQTITDGSIAAAVGVSEWMVIISMVAGSSKYKQHRNDTCI